MAYAPSTTFQRHGATLATTAGARGAAVAKASSVKDVAALAHVSLGTVSNVLNRPERVSPRHPGEGRAGHARPRVRPQRVRPPAARRAEPHAGLRPARRPQPLLHRRRAGRELAAESAGLSLFLCHSDNRAAREGDYLGAPRASSGCRGSCHARRPQRRRARRRTPQRHAAGDRRPHARRRPLLLGRGRRRPRRAPRRRAPRRAGHTRVAFIGGPETIGQVRDRLAGAREAWVAAGLPDDQLVVVGTEALTVAEGRSAGERVMGIASSRRPTAAFCANDLLALGLLQQLSTAGLSVPGDLAIVGYDDIEYAAAAAVPLTSVRQPRQELGRRPPSWCSTRRTTPTTCTSRSSSPPSSSPVVRPGAEDRPVSCGRRRPRWPSPLKVTLGARDQVELGDAPGR